jgi:hypothetical protein
MQQQQTPKTLLDLATDNQKMSNQGMTLEEALAQVDRLNGGDKELKRIIRDAYNSSNGKRQ